MKIRSRIRSLKSSLRQRWHHLVGDRAPKGSASWLIATEAKYGGLISNVQRNKVSPLDPRSATELQNGGMTGGDRMFHHGYAPKYAEFLRPFIGGKPVHLVEIGILKGTGLAIWCDLFANGKVRGFDIDLGHTRNNIPFLKSCGAFRETEPELHEFDQFVDNTDYVGSILKGDRLDICIDDGFHSNESIIITMKSLVPYLNDRFVYFIEDNSEVHRELRSLYPQFDIENCGELTVVSSKVKSGTWQTS